MIEQYQQRLDEIREERLRRSGLASSSSTTSSFSEDDIEQIKEERINRLAAVAEAEFAPKPAETPQKKTEVVDKSAHWWDKTKAFLKKYPTPFDFIQDGGIKKTAQAIYNKAQKKAEEERAKPVGQRLTEGLTRGIQGGVKTDTVLNWTARPVTRAAAATLGELTGQDELDPSSMGKAGEFIFGKDKVKSYSKQSEEINQAFGGKNPLTTVPIAAGMIALDFTGFGGKSKVTSSIVKAATREQAEKVIKKLGVEYSDDLAEKIIKTTDAKQAASLLDDLAKPNPLIQEARKGADELTWARGTRAGGIQNAGAKNYNQATRVLEKAGELPSEIKTQSVTKDFIKNYYETKKPPVVGDIFINAKGERIEITKIGDQSVDYFLKGKKKGIAGTIYSDNSFKSARLPGVEGVTGESSKALPVKSQPLQEGGSLIQEARKTPVYENPRKDVYGSFNASDGKVRVSNLNDSQTILHEVLHKNYGALPKEKQGALDYAFNQFNEKYPGAFTVTGNAEEDLARAIEDYPLLRKKFGGDFNNKLVSGDNGKILVDFFKKNIDETANGIKRISVKDRLSQPLQEGGSLIQEARKGDTIYRGQPAENKFRQSVSNVDASNNILVGKGVFATDSEKMAKSYGSNVRAFERPTKGVLDISNASDADLAKLGIDKETAQIYKKSLASKNPETIIGQKVDYQGGKYKIGTIFNVKGKPSYELRSTTYGEPTKFIPKGEAENLWKPKPDLSNVKDSEDILMNNIIERFTGGRSVEELVNGGASEAGKLKSAKEAASKWLNKQGYSFVKHQGGIRAGGGKELHDVYIALSDEALKPKVKSQPLQEGGIVKGGADAIEQQNKRLQILDQVKKEKVPVEIQKQVDEIPPERIKKIEEAFPEADAPFKLKANTAINVVKKDAKIKDDVNAWLKNSYKGKAEAQKEAVMFKIKENPENILKHEAGEAYEGRELVEKKFDELFKKAEDAGIKLEKRQNYIPHVYNESPEEITKAVSKAMEKKGVPKEMIQEYLDGNELPAEIAKSLKMNPFFNQERAFGTYKEAAEFGLTPKYKTMNQLVGHYTEKLNDVVANQTLIDDMVQHGHLSSSGGNGKMAVNLPGNEGVYFAKPEVAGYLNDYFRNEGALNVLQIGAKYGAKFSKGLQNIVLAGGVPGTNLNFFTFGHVVKSLTTGIGDLATLNFKGALTNFKSLSNVVRSNFTKRSIGWFNKRVENGVMGKIANEGIDMTRMVGNYKETNRGFVNFFKNTKAKNLIGESYDKVLQEKTFNSFLPMQTVSVFEDTYKAAIKKGLPEEAASKLAGDTTKNFMGLFNNLKGKTTQDAVSAVFFAPQFREGLIHTYWNTLKSLSPTTWTNPAFKQNRRLAIGMALTFFGGYDMLNKKLNGRHIWENPEGKKLELMIPGKDGKVYSVPFMPSQLAFFRNVVEGGAAMVGGDEKTAIQKAGSNLSMGLKLITDILGNKDYFGNEIYDNQAPRAEKYKDMAKYVGLNANHPYVKGLWNLYINHNAEQQPIYPMYQKITKLIDEGKREDAQVLIDTLDKEESLAYEEMRKQKIKPLAQVMSEMMEVPLRFTNVGKLKSQEYYKKIDQISRAVKALPEGAQQTEKIQEYMNAAPEAERRGILYALTKAGISTEGVSISEDIIRMKPIYNQVGDLVKQGKTREAQTIVNKLSEDDYKAYQKVTSSVKAKETKEAKLKMQPLVLKVKELAESGRKDEAKKIVNGLTDEEYRIYKLVVESLN